MSSELNDLIEPLIEILKKAADCLLEFHQQIEQLVVHHKSDNTLLTQADLHANKILHRELKKLTPDLPILSEEDSWPAFEERSKWTRYWLLDPLDGTRGFVDKSKEFSINIALIEKHQPIMGFIFIPTADICYYAIRGQGAYKQQKEATLKTAPLSAY